MSWSEYVAMDEDHGYACLSEMGAEVLMLILSFVMASIALSALDIEEITFKNTKMITKDEGIFMSATFALFLPLMSYLFSQAKQQGLDRAQLILTWMVLTEFLRIHSADHVWELKKVAEQTVRVLWVTFLVYNYSHPDELRRSLFILSVISLAGVVLKGIGFHQCKKSSRMGRNPEIIQNYMKSVMLEEKLETTPMDKCVYIVMGEENYEINLCENGYCLGKKKPNSTGILTIGTVYQDNTPETKEFTSVHPHWRDRCVSLALAKMLRLRFANLSLDHEAGSRKALKFVLEGLIGDIDKTESTSGETNLFRRVFKIIQDELMFVLEYSNTKVPTYKFFLQYYLASTISTWVMMGTGIYVICIICEKPYKWLPPGGTSPQHCTFHIFNYHNMVIRVFSGLDITLTITLVVACVYVRYKGLGTVTLSPRWRNYSSVKRFIKDRDTWCRKHRSLVGSKWTKLYPSKLVHNMIEKLASNYVKNFEQAIIHDSIFDIKIETIICTRLDGTILAPLAKWIRRIITRAYPTVFHSPNVKEAILRSLKNSGGQLTNGETSLKKYGIFEDLNQLYRPSASITEAILVWHIATTRFNQQKPPPPQNKNLFKNIREVISKFYRCLPILKFLFNCLEPLPEENNDPFKKEREVTLALSGYCHYLVANLPELLPDHVNWIEKLYKDVKKEVLDNYLSSSGKNCCNYARGDDTLDENSVVGKGEKLAEELVNYADVGEQLELVWAMLSEFWAEMILFIAPSDNVKGHEEILEKGELITQLWALLTHAGILTRPKPTEPPNGEMESNEGPDTAIANRRMETNAGPEIVIANYGMEDNEGPEITSV